MSTACLTRTGKRVSTLVDRIMKQNNRKWYHLYMDRCYNSAGLMLFGKHRMGFYCSGTCHVNHSVLTHLRLFLLPDTEGEVSAHFFCFVLFQLFFKKKKEAF